MKIYKLSQTINNDYDTYDSLVVIAQNEDEARKIHPSPYVEGDWWNEVDEFSGWVNVEKNCLEHVKVEYLGEASPGLSEGIIVTSFNAG